MLIKLFNFIKEALIAMVGYKSITNEIKMSNDIVSDKMSDALTKWRNIYEDKPEWQTQNIRSVGTAQQACELIAMLILSELKLQFLPENYDINKGGDIDENSLAAYIQKCFDKHLLKKLRHKLEYAMAMGGMVIKPYISNGQVYFDFVNQGEFIPLAFDDDGNITDIAFKDQFKSGNVLYTRIERQTFSENKIVVENKAYQANISFMSEDEYELGHEINIEKVDKWKHISPEPVIIEDVDRPLFGYFKVSKANKVDMKSPLGVSFFSTALFALKKIDEQFSRYDWEFEGGEMAIDVDPNAVKYTKRKFPFLPKAKDRIFRYIDIGSDETYKPYNPSLRDESFRKGLDDYYRMAEDRMGLARGCLSNIDASARTATEIKTLKQLSYDTVNDNQQALEDCLRDVIYATVQYIKLYKKTLAAPQGKFEISIDWGDGVLVDRDSETDRKLQLVDKGIMSKGEFRSWYTGEPLNIAKNQIQDIIDTNRSNFVKDIIPDDNE